MGSEILYAIIVQVSLAVQNITCVHTYAVVTGDKFIRYKSDAFSKFVSLIH